MDPVFGLLVLLLVGSVLGAAIALLMLKKAEKDGRIGIMGW